MRAALLAHDEVLRSRITAHDRHAASFGHLGGANPKVVQRMLGTPCGLTLDVYADLFE